MPLPPADIMNRTPLKVDAASEGAAFSLERPMAGRQAAIEAQAVKDRFDDLALGAVLLLLSLLGGRSGLGMLAALIVPYAALVFVKLHVGRPEDDGTNGPISFMMIVVTGLPFLRGSRSTLRALAWTLIALILAYGLLPR